MLFIETVSLTDVGLADWARLAGQSQGILLSLQSQCWDYIELQAGVLYPGIFTWVPGVMHRSSCGQVSTLLTEPSPQPIFQIFKEHSRKNVHFAIETLKEEESDH